MRMCRHLSNVAVFCLAGALMNLGIASLFAVGPRNDRHSDRPGAMNSVWDAGKPANWPALNAPGAFITGRDSMGRRVDQVVTYDASLGALFVAETRTGWPWPSFHGWMSRRAGGSPATATYGLPVRRPMGASGVAGNASLVADYLLVPYKPLGWGFVANTALYSVLIAGSAALMLRIRRRLRYSSGVCVQCGYRILGFPVCPECGAAARAVLGERRRGYVERGSSGRSWARGPRAPRTESRE